MKQKITVFAFFMLTLIFPQRVKAFSSVSPSGHTLYYNICGNIACVMRNTAGYSGNLIIPDSVINPNTGIKYPVTYIASQAFRDNDDLLSVIIGNNIDTIGASAFRGCTNLTHVILPNSIKKIDDGAFYECTSLSTISIPDNLQDIGEYAFYRCSQLDTIRIPNGLKIIGEGAYSYCTGLSMVLYNADSCVSICSAIHPVFESCSSLTTVTVGNNVKTMPCNLFYQCSSLTTVNFNADSCVFMGGYYGYIFMHCPNFVNLNIGANVKAIPANAFRTCSGLTSVTIPDSIQYVGSDAFSSCTSLSEITLLPVVAPGYSESFNNTPEDKVFHLKCGSYPSYSIVWGDYNYDEPIANVNISLETNNDEWGAVSTIKVPPMYNDVRCDSTSVIHAIPNYGYHFEHWNTASIVNPDTIQLLGDTTIVAFFAKNWYYVIGVPNDINRGMVTGNDTVEYLDSVTLTATANYGYHFVRWSDFSTENPYTILANQNKSFYAIFLPNQYSIELETNNTDRGMVAGQGVYDYLSQCTITAIPNYGYHFTQWSDGDITNPRIVTLTKDTSFTAFFERNVYHVNGEANDTNRGMVIGSDSSLYLDSITLSAIPSYGYHFVYWNDGCTDNPRVVVASADISLVAFFDFNQYSLLAASTDSIMGVVIGGGVFDYLSDVCINVLPNYGYHFTAWNDGDTANPRTITLKQDTTFTALFAKNQYMLTVQSNDETQGSVSDGGVFEYLDTATIIASASEHYHFVRWDDGNTDNPREYVIVGDATLTAIFVIDTHTVTVTPNNIARGMVEATGSEFSYGTPCTVTATAYTGYVFTHWSNGITANPYTFAVLGDTELIAIFDEEGTQGIDDVANTDNIRIFSKYDRILIDGLDGQDVTIYTIDGRAIASLTRATEHVAIPVTTTGVYIVKIGDYPARKVVVIK